MSFQLSIPAKADGGRMAEIHVQAMYTNPLLHAQFPSEASIRHLQKFLAHYYAEIVSGQDESNVRTLVARHVPSGRIAAFACWDVPPGEDGATKEKVEDGELKYSEGCRREYLEDYAALATSAEERVMKGEKCYHLTFVCTDPDHQRQGAGAALTRAVLDQARADGVPVYLESTAEAVGMYEKIGFAGVDGFEMAIPARVQGVTVTEATEKYSEVCMVWRAQV